MLNRKDWLISFVTNLLFIVILILMMYKTGILFTEEKKEFVIELASVSSIPTSMRESRFEIEKPQGAIPHPIRHVLPKADNTSYIPSEKDVQTATPDSIDWTSSDIDLPDMPVDPFLDNSDPFIELDPLMEDFSENVSVNNQNWNFSWNDGNERRIQYIPPWDYYVNREISHQLDRLVLTFEISPDGYVSNVVSQESLFLNEAWFTLIENWLSRMVFEPGKEGQGSLTLVFENNSL